MFGSGNACSLYKYFEPQYNMLSAEVSFYETFGGAESQFRFMDGETTIIQVLTGITDGKPALRYATDTGQRISIAEIEGDKWHKLKINADIQKGRFDVYLDGILAGEGLSMSRRPGRIDYFGIYGWGTRANDLYVKGISVKNRDVEPVAGGILQPRVFTNKPPKLETAPTVENYKGIIWGHGSEIKYRLTPTTWYLPGIESDVKDFYDMGIHWARVPFNIETTFEDLDLRTELLEKNNIIPVMQYDKRNPDKTYGTPEQEAENAAKLKEILKRYKGRWKYVEIGNEANLISYWQYEPDTAGMGSGDPDTPYGRAVHNYVSHLENSYRAIKEVDPEITVLIGGLSEWTAAEFIKQLTVEKAYLWFDEFAFHPYAGNPKDVRNKMKLCRQSMREWPEPYNNMAIWITEIGFHTAKGWSSPGAVDDEYIKSVYMTEVYRELLEEMGGQVRPIMWYTYLENGDTVGYGVVQKSYVNGTFKQERISPPFDALASIDDTVLPPQKTPEDNEAVKADIPDGLIPVRSIDAVITWNGDTQSALIEKNGVTVECMEGKYAKINGVYVLTEIETVITDGKMYAPEKLFEKAFGKGY
jgi:hypothetical protein